ncbi:MAG: hypothetical protein AMXMBFR66_11220 [Pseudomonadota bacterium]|nr:hypothetical protein [Rubrivivax sp.]NLZ42026.1 hypothetical protein [Comamonadaceae bacterium]
MHPKAKPTLYADARLRELADASWLMSFARQFPAALSLARHAEDRHLSGAIDVHVHADPCLLAARNQDYTEVAVAAARAGLRAVVRKDHYQSTVGEAYAVQRHIDDLVERGDLAQRVEVFGGIPLGRLELAPIRLATRFAAFRMIWLNAIGGERLLDAQGRVRTEAEQIIALAAEHRRGLNVGAPSHSAAQYPDLGDYDGLAPLVETIKRRGALAVLDHPLSSLTIDEIARLTGDGVYAGLFCYPSLPSLAKAPVADPLRTLELVTRVGAENCIVATDVGMMLEYTQLEGLRQLIRLLQVLGCSAEQIDLMVKTNPARLLGL